MGKKFSKVGKAVGEARKKAYSCAAEMPPLHHKWKGEPYDVMESEVVEWLVEQPEVRERVFYEARQSGMIEYDRETGEWVGSDFYGGDEW